MPKTVFHRETNAKEEWLEINEDGSFTYHVENSGWPAAKKGLEPREASYTLAQAIERWPGLRAELEGAAKETAERRGKKT